jgi:hypothetical protein
VVAVVVCIIGTYKITSLFREFIDPQHKKNVFVLFKDLCFLGYKLSCYKLKRIFCKSSPTHESFKKDFIKFPYVYNDKTYYHIEKIPKVNIPIKEITDEDGNDISESILPYLPLDLRYKRIGLCPSDFGYKKITITTWMDKSYIFEDEDVIHIN